MSADWRIPKRDPGVILVKIKTGGDLFLFPLLLGVSIWPEDKAEIEGDLWGPGCKTPPLPLPFYPLSLNTNKNEN